MYIQDLNSEIKKYLDKKRATFVKDKQLTDKEQALADRLLKNREDVIHLKRVMSAYKMLQAKAKTPEEKDKYVKKWTGIRDTQLTRTWGTLHNVYEIDNRLAELYGKPGYLFVNMNVGGFIHVKTSTLMRKKDPATYILEKMKKVVAKEMDKMKKIKDPSQGLLNQIEGLDFIINDLLPVNIWKLKGEYEFERPDIIQERRDIDDKMTEAYPIKFDFLMDSNMLYLNE